MSEMLVHKVTLSSGKKVLLRPIKIRDQELAAQAAANSVGSDNQVALAVVMQKELVKLLLVQIDEKAPSAAEREDLDSLLEFQEYTQVTQVVQKLMGVDQQQGNLKTELVSSGSK
jgi:hypothetical protein